MMMLFRFLVGVLVFAYAFYIIFIRFYLVSFIKNILEETCFARQNKVNEFSVQKCRIKRHNAQLLL